MLLNMDRRKFLIGSTAVIIAAPAIVQIANIMKVRPIINTVKFTIHGLVTGDRVLLVNQIGEVFEGVAVNGVYKVIGGGKFDGHKSLTVMVKRPGHAPFKTDMNRLVT